MEDKEAQKIRMKKMKKGVLIIGDLMLGRDSVKGIKENGLQYYFDPIKHLMKDRYTIANLECVLADDLKTREGIKNPLIAPTWMAEQLKEVGLDAVSLANNHIMDCGEEGKESTKNHLSDNNVRYFDDKNIIIKISDRLVSFSSACAPFEDVHISAISDYRIFMPHSGIELFQYPLPKDERSYKRLARYSRVDLIAGSHSHCIQAGERHEGGFIFYGLGDFISDCHKNWGLFWGNEAHPKKFLKKDLTIQQKEYFTKNLINKSLILSIDFDEFKPKIKIYTLVYDMNNPFKKHPGYLYEDCQQFENLVFNYAFDNEVLKERYRIEEELCKTLKE